MASACAICLDILMKDMKVCPCGHVFHAKCIWNALSRRSECPTCRAPVNTKESLVALFLEFENRESQKKNLESQEVLSLQCTESTTVDVQNLKVQLQEAQKKCVKMQTMIGHLDSNVAELQEHLNTKIMQFTEEKEKVGKLKQKINNCNQELCKSKTNVMKLQRDKQELSDQLAQYSKAKLVMEFIEENDIEKLKKSVKGNALDTINILQKANDFRLKEFKRVVEDNKILQQEKKQLQDILYSSSVQNLYHNSKKSFSDMDKGKLLPAKRLKMTNEKSNLIVASTKKHALMTTGSSSSHRVVVTKRKEGLKDQIFSNITQNKRSPKAILLKDYLKRSLVTHPFPTTKVKSSTSITSFFKK